MSSSSFASSFAPYMPPPDDPAFIAASKPATTRAWFPTQHVTSYQSGGVPTFNTSQSGGLGAVEAAEVESGVNSWETAYGMRVEVLAAFAYLLGPISALVLLIFETHNDYVRFHAYQSALLSTPLILIRILASLLGFAPFLLTTSTLSIVIPSLFMAWRAFIDASRNGLSRFVLPTIGPVAERWVTEE